MHSLQSVAAQVRSFAFVKDMVEITDLFAEHRIEDALSLVLAGLPAGGLLDVDADSDYGTAFEQFLEQYGSAVTRRTTLLVLGDGRGNGKDPRLPVFEELARRARATVWLTPEPRYSWGLGRLRPAGVRGVLRPGPGGAQPARPGEGDDVDVGRGPMTSPAVDPGTAPIDALAPTVRRTLRGRAGRRRGGARRPAGTHRAHRAHRRTST